MNNKIFILATTLMVLSMYSCQNDEAVDDIGYLRMEIGAITATASQTKTIISNYNPKQLKVEIIDANGKVVESTNDHTAWGGKTFNLPAGSYTIQASSYGFDGTDSGEDCPYYSGNTTVFIEKGKQSTATVTCTLANVKVTVNFDGAFKEAFKSTVVTVGSTKTGVSSFKFKPEITSKPVYFPVGNLSTQITVINKNGENHTQTKEITGVEARDHYILNYKLANEGEGSITVTANGEETIYTFLFPVTTEVTTGLTVKDINAWSNFAYVTGYISGTEEGKMLDPTKMVFEYKTSTATTWNSIAATEEGENFKATLKNLIPGTQYQCRLVYRNENEEYVSSVQNFTTEEARKLQNGNFDQWYQKDGCWYPDAEENVKTTGSFWDTSNPGSATFSINVTTGNGNVVHTAGGKSAKLESQNAVIKFAAASLYTGSFGGLVDYTKGAKINFGQPFTSRPTSLKGFFRYAPGNMKYIKNPPITITSDMNDICSIYIALTTKVYTVDNTDTSTFVDWENDPGVVAYGELPASECVSTNGEWKAFNIPFKYHDLNKKPTHIIVVCSSSKYGDYFTGGNSILYLDDFELVYGDTPVTK